MPRRGRRRRQPVLDLHGLDRDAAVRRIHRWLEQAYVEDVGSGIVICGWGRGVLLETIGEVLGGHPLVAAHRKIRARYVVEIQPRNPD